MAKFLFIFFSLSTIAQTLSTTFTLTNNCNYPLWPGILSNSGNPPLSFTGFSLNPGETRPLDAPSSWSGRMWARTLCSVDPTGRFTCATGDCGSGTVECPNSGAAPPATLAEFTLNGNAGLDFYDVSLVDGYNVPMLVVPQSGYGSGCRATGCAVDLNGICPAELRVVVGGGVVACKSACEAFGSPEFCCSGQFGNPNTCVPSDYSKLFKNACPRAYSYAYDDPTSMFTCEGVGNYIITYCPSTTSLKSLEGHHQESEVPIRNDTMLFLEGQGFVNHATPTLIISPLLHIIIISFIIIFQLSFYFFTL